MLPIRPWGYSRVIVDAQVERIPMGLSQGKSLNVFVSEQPCRAAQYNKYNILRGQNVVTQATLYAGLMYYRHVMYT